MPVVDVFDRSKNKVGDIELNDAVFAINFEDKQIVFSEVVKMQMAAWRRGTHSTKTYATISGGGVKPWKQKGTGRARRGTLRASTLRGGAPAFGPQPRDYSYSVPKKKRRLALKAVLSERLASEQLFVIKEFGFDTVKTKEARTMLQGTWNLNDAVIIGGDKEENFILSLRNLKEYLFLHVSQVNVYDIAAYKNVVLTEDAVKELNEVLVK